VIAKLTPTQYCEALRVDYAVAWARTVAGVHYPMDNMAGLNLGTLVSLDKLPELLSERYGSDPEAVRTRMETLKFEWEDFDPYNCTIASVPVGDRLAY
jgi:hypothetical protein